MLLILRLTLAFLFAILGVVGAVLPILQGWLFFLASLVLLFPQSRLAVKAVEKIEPKMPRLARVLRKLEIGLPRETAQRS